MPLAGIREVLEHRHDPSVVEALLAAHLRRLEQGVVDARRELSSVRTLLTSEDPPMTTLSIDVTALAEALGAVRFAVGADPEFPVLCGGPGAVTCSSRPGTRSPSTPRSRARDRRGRHRQVRRPQDGVDVDHAVGGRARSAAGG